MTLKTKITYGPDTESYKLTTFGTSLNKGSDLYLQYTEESEAGTTNTTIKHKSDETLLLRSGAFKMRQIFRLQETTNGHYENVYGTFGLLTTTNHISHQWNEIEQEGQLTLRYQLHMQGSEPGQYEMTIIYKNIKE